MKPNSEKPNRHKVQLSLDLRIVVIILLLVIGGMLAAWRPWQTAKSSDGRTISVTGDATLKAEPDEYDFNPSYSFDNADKSAAIAAATSKSSVIVGGLKQLGLTDKQIKTNVDGYENDDGTIDSYSYTLGLTITVDNKALAQKVQDYLATTSPEGSVTAQPTFSTAKEKSLQAAARDQATKDARSKADQSATNLGFKVDRVKTVQDGSGFGTAGPLMAQSNAGGKDAAVSSPSLGLQPGQNDLSYSVSVTYYIK